MGGTGGLALGDQLGRAARAGPHRPALRHRGSTTTWRQLDGRVDRVAAALRQRGVTAGARVVVLCANRPELIWTLLAAWRLGAIGVPVNIRLEAAEVAHVLGDADPVAIIVDPERAHLVPGAGTPGEVVVLSPGADPDPAPIGGTGAGLTWRPPVADDDPALILYTSGTTGRAKGAVLSHANLAVTAYNTLLTRGIHRPDEVSLLAMPLFHIGGLTSWLPYLMIGAACVLPDPGGWDAASTLDLLETERVTSCVLVPSQWRDVCGLAGIGDRRLALRRIAWSASAAPDEVLAAMAEVFAGIPCFSSYGQTEMSSVTTLLGPEDAVTKRGSVGRPVPNVELRLVDDAGHDVHPGAVGEVVYRGPTVFQGYWHDPVATSEAFADGWFHSGDLARMDEDGCLWVVDRKKDMIISGGENIYARELEAVLEAHPKVAEVAVVGRPHPQWVETPVAFVVATDPADPPTLDDLVAACRSRLASYKKPTGMVVTDALPRNASGKVVKRRL